MFSLRRSAFAVAVLAAGFLAGCSSKEQKALDQAKQQAASSGQPQQVVSVDNNGTTTTTIVQPPENGQKQQAMTTTTSPAPAGQPKPGRVLPAHDERHPDRHPGGLLTRAGSARRNRRAVDVVAHPDPDRVW